MKLQIAAESLLVIWQHVLDNVIKTREVNKAQKQEMYTLHCTRAFPRLTTMAAFSPTLNQQPMPAFVFVIPPPLFPLLSICQLECKGAVWSENIKGIPRCCCSSFLCSHQENDLDWPPVKVHTDWPEVAFRSHHWTEEKNPEALALCLDVHIQSSAKTDSRQIEKELIMLRFN